MSEASTWKGLLRITGHISLQSALGSKATHVGGVPPEMTAKLLLSELVRTRAGATH